MCVREREREREALEFLAYDRVTHSTRVTAFLSEKEKRQVTLFNLFVNWTSR